MATVKGKPVGYFKHLLAVDCETTGLDFNSDHPSNGHQAVSWGIVVLDSETFEQVEELYVEVKWNDISKAARKADPKFGKRAEEIHGLTFDYLEENGVTEEEAIEMIGAVIMKYWGPSVSIRLLGHNVHLFDLDFLRDLFRRHGIPLKFGNRHYDTNSIGWCAFETFTSDQLFELIGFDARGDHNALDDIKMTIAAAKAVRDIVQNAING